MGDYEYLFSQTADAMCEVSTTGEIIRINESCRRLLGVTEDLHPLTCFFDDDGAARLTGLLQDLVTSGETQQFEGFQPDHHRWSSWQLTCLAENRTVAVGRDVTEHHRTARDLEEKSVYLHSIIEAEPECVKIVAADGELLDMNRAGLTMVGATDREDVIGQSVYDLMAPEDRDRFIEFNSQVCQGEAGELSFEIIALDGTRRSMETIAVPLARPGRGHDEPLMHLAITRDVTQRHVLENQLRQSQKIEAIGHLAGGVAHDFNNLLTAIIGPAELALMQVGEHSPVSPALREIVATSERAARLTQKLLAFARQQVVKLETVSLAKLVLNLREMLDRLLGETVRLSINTEPPEKFVRADRGHMEQVLLNLVVNARDALNSDGAIAMVIRNQRVSEMQAGHLGCDAGEYVVLDVIDNGSGIPEEVQPHIFDPFFTTKAPGQGTGLGLSTCYGIVRQLGGVMAAESTDRGTRMSVFLPAVETPDAVEEASQSVSTAPSAEILVVEDQPQVRSTIARMLELDGHTVHEAENGVEALCRLQSLPEVDLVISDMSMPEMSGRELAARLQADFPSIGVLFVTGNLGVPEDVTDDSQPLILQKPFTIDQLTQAVDATMRRGVTQSG